MTTFKQGDKVRVHDKTAHPDCCWAGITGTFSQITKTGMAIVHLDTDWTTKVGGHYESLNKNMPAIFHPEGLELVKGD